LFAKDQQLSGGEVVRVSIITPSLNAAGTIADTLQSVAEQVHPNLEHIVIDGGSRDATLGIVGQFAHVSKVVSERDDGIYDAMNKGWRMASGDLVGWLNADDMLAGRHAVTRIVDAAADGTPIVAASIDMVDPLDTSRVIRRYSSAEFSPAWLRYSYAVPHPGFYIRRDVLERIGGYDLQFPLAADFDLIARAIYREKVPYKLLSDIVVRMRIGGRSSGVKAALLMLDEVYRSCKKNGIPTNRLLMLFRYIHKAKQYLTPLPLMVDKS
jgi:glycosyltransferase involved in cell wall biosynthesis